MVTVVEVVDLLLVGFLGARTLKEVATDRDTQGVTLKLDSKAAWLISMSMGLLADNVDDIFSSVDIEKMLMLGR